MNGIDWLTKGRRPYWFCGFLSLFFLTGLGAFHLFDWDEINFAESAREMLVSGNFMRVQINYETFWEKPPFFFWLQAGAMKIFGVGEYAARFPNAVFGLLYLLTLFQIGKTHESRRFGLIWALLFFASLLPHLYFKSGIIDPVFNYFIFLSVYFLYRSVSLPEAYRRYFPLLAGVFSGLSVITKGPVGFLLLALTFTVYLILTRFANFPKAARFLKFALGLLVVVGLWLSLELIQNGPDNMLRFIEYQLALFNRGVAGHAQPFWYHVVVVFFGCFPMSVLALPMLKKTPDHTGLMRWMKCLFWVVLILFSIVTTKIIHYSSMCYVPLSYLAAQYLYRRIQEQRPVHPVLLRINLVLGILIGIGIGGAIYFFQHSRDFLHLIKHEFTRASMDISVHWRGWEWTIAVVFIALSVFAFRAYRQHRLQQGLLWQAANTAVVLLALQLLVVPKIEPYTQGPMLEFLENKQGEDCYIQTSGFKSYAHYFYARIPQEGSDIRRNKNRLLNGPVDKPVYFITKVHKTQMREHPGFVLMYEKGGFGFYRRVE